MNGGWQVKGKNYKGCQGFELADHMNWGPLTKSSKAKPVFFCGRENGQFIGFLSVQHQFRENHLCLGPIGDTFLKYFDKV